MFSRLESLIGIDKLNIIKSKTILVVGLGGVGGECVLSLARSGVENIVIIDYDVIDISNINRQVIAFNSTIGMKKIDVLKKMILDINPNCNVIAYDLFLDENNLKDVFNIKIDYVIDACDFVPVKKAMIKYCLENRIKFISSMGTGNKFDPSKLEITDIRKTINDPLARIFRKWVRDNKIKDKIMVLSSKEVPLKLSNIVASNSFVPNSAGLLITSYVIRDIIK